MVQDNPPEDPFRFEREIAISILTKRDLAALKALKQFLLNMSGPKAIETVLAQAVCGCAEADPEALAWILAQADQLEPELSLERWMQRRVVTCLGDHGFAVELACFEQQANAPRLRLSLEERAMQLLREKSSKGEWLLLNGVFETNWEGG